VTAGSNKCLSPGRRNSQGEAPLRAEKGSRDVTKPAGPENQALINLLHSWREEDATDDPQELKRRDAETNTLMSNLQASRLSLREPEA